MKTLIQTWLLLISIGSPATLHAQALAIFGYDGYKELEWPYWVDESFINLDRDAETPSDCLGYLQGIHIEISGTYSAFGKTYDQLPDGSGPSWSKTWGNPPIDCGLAPHTVDFLGDTFYRLIYQWGSTNWSAGCDSVNSNAGAAIYTGFVSSGTTTAARWDCAQLVVITNYDFDEFLTINLTVREQTSSTTYNELQYDLTPEND